jgi:hypothetical protein
VEDGKAVRYLDHVDFKDPSEPPMPRRYPPAP